MIYLILLIVMYACSAVMDASDNIAKWFKKKGRTNLWGWFNSKSWENKYKLRDWLIEKGFNRYIAEWIAKDIFVVFTDGWHCAKAIMFLCADYMTADKLQGEYSFNVVFTTIILFLVGGSFFNFLYYKLRKLAA